LKEWQVKVTIRWEELFARTISKKTTDEEGTF
jgi:hypothetical protein